MALLQVLVGLDPDIDKRKNFNSEFSSFDVDICYQEDAMQSTLKNQFIYCSDIVSVEQDIRSEINDIAKLQDNWNGYGTGKINCEVINNTLKLINAISPSILYYLRPDNVYPSKLGTITLDFEFDEDNILSIEVAKDSIGYYMNVNGENYKHIDGLKLSEENSFDNVVSLINHDISIFLS